MQLFQRIADNLASLVIGKTLPDKREFIRRYVLDGLDKGTLVLFITTDRSPGDIKKELFKSSALIGLSEESLKFIDCYSYLTDKNIGLDDDIKPFFAQFINVIDDAINKCLAQPKKGISGEIQCYRVIYDSLSTTLKQSGTTKVLSLLYTIIPKIKNTGGSVIFTLEGGVHDSKTVVALEHLMDCAIRIKKEKENIIFDVDGIRGIDSHILSRTGPF